MSLDPTSNIGRVRLRVADYSDLPIFPDSVYQSVIEDSGNNLPRAAKTMAQFILGALSHKTHRKLAQLEVWGSESFQNYLAFLVLTVKDPAFMDCSPIPYSSNADFSPILSFQAAWNSNFTAGTEAQALAATADLSPNDNSRTYPY